MSTKLVMTECHQPHRWSYP